MCSSPPEGGLLFLCTKRKLFTFSFVIFSYPPPSSSLHHPLHLTCIFSLSSTVGFPPTMHSCSVIPSVTLLHPSQSQLPNSLFGSGLFPWTVHFTNWYLPVTIPFLSDWYPAMYTCLFPLFPYFLGSIPLLPHVSKCQLGHGFILCHEVCLLKWDGTHVHLPSFCTMNLGGPELHHELKCSNALLLFFECLVGRGLNPASHQFLKWWLNHVAYLLPLPFQAMLFSMYPTLQECASRKTSVRNVSVTWWSRHALHFTYSGGLFLSACMMMCFLHSSCFIIWRNDRAWIGVDESTGANAWSIYTFRWRISFFIKSNVPFRCRIGFFIRSTFPFRCRITLLPLRCRISLFIFLQKEIWWQVVMLVMVGNIRKGVITVISRVVMIDRWLMVKEIVIIVIIILTFDSTEFTQLGSGIFLGWIGRA